MNRCHITDSTSAETHITDSTSAETHITDSTSAETQLTDSTSTEMHFSSTPKSKSVNISLNRSITSPLSKEEENVHTQLTKRKLAFAGKDEMIQCKTGGQPLYLMKVTKARQSSANARSPLKKKRARSISKHRSIASGSAEEDQQTDVRA